MSAETGEGRRAAAETARWLGARLAEERDRWPLWLPVGLGVGVAVYFALPVEPGPVPGLVLLILAFALACLGLQWLRSRGQGEALVICAFIVGAPALGFAAAKYQSDSVAAPVIVKRTGPVEVRGRIEAVEPGLKGPRVTIRPEIISRLERSRTPRRVRIRLRPSSGREAGSALHPGAGIKVLAILMPPPGPAVPGGFDFARDAWFDGIGGVGFALRTPGLTPEQSGAESGWLTGANLWVADLRARLFARITRALPGSSGGIAAALMTGERGRIPEETMEAMRAAGLAHLLAISGLHIGLVTGILFFGLRALLALFPGLALNWPIKKWAAGAALAGGFAYMLLTGATVPTQRAFLMAALVLGAVMLDRSALNMRLVAFAAVVILLIAPASLTGPSFQMSFAAVAALIAGYEVLRGPMSRLVADGGVSRRGLAYIAGVGITTLIAGLATAPFALYHFNRFAVFGLAANLGAVPLTAFWIMPFAVLAYLLMPFGLESLALQPMGLGISWVIAIAEAISSSPGASLHVPTMPIWGLGLITIGGLWLILWRRPWRLAGLAGIVAGLLSIAAAPAPDLLISGDGRSLAIRDPNGALIFADSGGSRFQRDIWLRRSGLAGEAEQKRDPGTIPHGPDLKGEGDRVLRCDSLACIAKVKGRIVSVIRNPGAAREDCGQADLVIALTTLYRFPCRGPERIILRRDLVRGGTHAIWFRFRGGVRIETVAGRRGERPWTGRPR